MRPKRDKVADQFTHPLARIRMSMGNPDGSPFTQRQLADQLEVSKSYVQLIELSQRTPSRNFVEKLAERLKGVEPEKFLVDCAAHAERMRSLRERLPQDPDPNEIRYSPERVADRLAEQARDLLTKIAASEQAGELLVNFARYLSRQYVRLATSNCKRG